MGAVSLDQNMFAPSCGMPVELIPTDAGAIYQKALLLTGQLRTRSASTSIFLECNPFATNVKAMKLRKHQAEMLQICDQIRAGVSRVRMIVASVTPGGGKSYLPVIAAARLIPTVADAICWVVPRHSLQVQAEKAFMDRNFRDFLGHHHTIRCATNEHNPCKGLSGYVTTYQALGFDRSRRLNEREFATKRYMLFLDEPHHIEVGSPTHEAIKPLVERAAIVIFASGTFERGDGQRIAFLPYQEMPGCAVLNLASLTRPDIALIEYNRRDALAEKAIIPLLFHLVDGRAEWIDGEGASRITDSIAEAGEDTGDALHTALNTEYAFELLERCLEDWQAHKLSNHRSKMLVVAANIKTAKRYLERLKELGVKAEIATSEDSKAAKQAIKRFKNHGKGATTDILVTVAMAYEGLDVPAATHIACLTHIRSTPWIEQMVTRAARVDSGSGALAYEHQFGYIYAPDDQLFQNCIANIEAEQQPFLKERQETARNGSGASSDEPGPSTADIIPLTSAPTRERAKDLNGKALEYDETQLIMDTMKKAGLCGISPIQFKQAIEIRQSHKPVSNTSSELSDMTPSEIEEKLRQAIESHNRQYERQNNMEHGTLNTQIMIQFGKSRNQMTIEELKRVWAWVQEKYPIKKLT